MTNGKTISTTGWPGSERGVRVIEASLRDLHEAQLAVQRAADDLSDAREAAIAEAAAALGLEARYLDNDSDVQLSWDGGDDQLIRTLVAEPDELKELLGDYLDTGTQPAELPGSVRHSNTSTGEIEEWPVAPILEDLRATVLRTEDELAPVATAVQARLDQTWDRVVQLIRAWISDPPATATEDWGRVLRGWRKALGLRGNRAAEILGVSPPALTRYEKGTRSPSMAYVESMAARIMGHGAQPPEEAASLFRFSARMDTPVAEVLEILEAGEAGEHELREQLGAVLDSLPIDDIRLLFVLAQSPEALSALRYLPRRDGLAPLRTALAELGGEEA